MRSDCVAAVTQAAAQMGRKLSATDLRGIEDLVTQKYKALAIADRNKFSKMTEVERLQEASEMAAGEVVHNAIKKRQRAELQLLRDAEFDATFEHMIGKGMSPADAMERILFFRADGKGGITSLRSVINAQDAFWKSRLSDLWKMEHKNLINIFTDKKMQSDFVNELYGKDSGNAMAKKAAEGYKNLSEEIRQQMNEAGFDIRRLDDYRSPQKLSYWRVYQEAKTPEKRAAMVDEFMRNLDRSRYVEKDGSPMSDANLAKFVDEAIQTIITDGMNKKIAQGTGSIANRGSQARQLHWKDAESFIQMMDKYSETNIVDQIYGQIHQLATDLTLAKSFGPNVVHSFDTKMTKVMQDRNPAVIKKANKVQAMFDNLVGLNGEIANPTVHRAFNTARQMFSAALLGSNTITQMSDQSTLAMTARAMNVPVLKAFTEEAKFLADAGHRDLVRSMAGALDSMSNMIARVADQNSAGFWGNANNVLMQINLSAHMTNAVRAGYTAAAYSHYGSLAKRSFSDLKPIDRALLEAKGVNESMWNLLGKADLTEGQYLSPNDIKRISDADVFSAMPERRQAIFDQAKGIQEKMEAQNQKESGWLQNRQTKFAEYKDKIQKMIDDYVSTREKRVEDYSSTNMKRGGEMMARLEQAEVDLELTKASIDATNERRADKFAEEVKRGMETYGRRRSEIGETLGAKRHSAKLQAAGADRAYTKLSEQLIAKKNELFGHERVEDGLVVIGELNKAVKELDAYTAKLEKRIDNSYKKDGGVKKGKEGTIERAEKLKEDAKIEYEAIKQSVEAKMNSLKGKVVGSQMEIQGVIDAIEAKKNRAEVEADIASYLATEKSADKIQGLLDTLEFRRDQTADRMMSEGERIGYKKAMADAKVKAMVKREEAYAKTANKEVFAKATELEKRIDKRMAELEEFTGSITKRMESRQGIADEWQSKIGDKLSKEAENIRNDTMLKYLAMVLEESHMASLQPSDISSAFLKGSGKRGELPSEIMGLLTQFKSFPVAMMFQHVIDRGLMGGKGIANKNTYLASLALFSTITGGMALLLGDIAAGRDPRTIFDENDPMKLAKFGGQAMLKGGAFGAIADILNPQAYEGREPGISLFGPAVGFAVNAGQAAFAGGKMAVAYISDDGEEFSKQSRTLAAEGMQLAKSSIPFQNLWWIRAAFHNYFLNEIHEFMAPGYKDRLKGALEKNYGAEQWASPDGLRAPDFGNIVQQ